MIPGSPETPEPEALSWDSASSNAPERPSFVSNLPDDTLISRPRRVGVSLILVIAGVMAFTALNILAAFNFEAIRETTIAALPEDLTTDYAESDVQGAVHLLLAAVGGIALLLSVVQVASAVVLWMRRSRSSRAALAVSTVLQLPVAFLAFVLRDAGVADAAFSIAAAAVLIVAVVVVFTPPVSHWLKQDERPRTIPLLPAETDTR